MKQALFFLPVLLLAANFCQGQQNAPPASTYTGHWTLQNNVSTNALLDKEKKSRFILDSIQVHITAIDSNGTRLWSTDPWKDNNLTVYRVKRPVIVAFYFVKNKFTDGKDAIWIVYNNTQFGFLEKDTGKFTWLGQD